MSLILAVPDVDAALRRALDLGAQVQREPYDAHGATSRPPSCGSGRLGGAVIDEPTQQAYGKSALCTDDQGTRFYLGEL